MRTRLLKVALRTIQTVHHIVIVGVVTAPVWSLMLFSPVFAVIISSVATWRIVSRARCPLTLLELHIRKSLGLELFKGFISHYYVKPFRKLIKSRFWSDRA